MVTRFESTRWEDARVLVTLSNEASAELKSREEWAGKRVIRWRLRLTPPAWVEWAEGGASVLLGTRRHLAMAAAAWILLWSGGNLDVNGLEAETAAALMGLHI